MAAERVAWLTSARDQAAGGLLTDVLEHGITIAVVACDTSSSPYVERIQALCAAHGVPFFHLLPPMATAADASSKKKQRELYDAQVVQTLRAYGCSLLLLAGYMRIVTRELTSQFRVVLNLHPSPPLGPIGRWQDVVWCLIAVRAMVAGAMLHIPTDEIDRGPVISYYTVPISGDDFLPLWTRMEEKLTTRSLVRVALEEKEQEPLFRAIRERQFDREAPLLIATLTKLIDGSLTIISPLSGGVRFAGQSWPEGLNLTQDVERLLTQKGQSLKTPEGPPWLH